MSQFMQPPIILLKEGTDSTSGTGQLISNINATQAVVDTIRTTLGPRGMDKLFHDGARVTISNDGATIMKLLNIVHPAAQTLVDIAKSQDAEVGDGTTSVVILAGELLKECKGFVEENLHPVTIIRAYRQALEVSLAKIKELAVTVDKGDAAKTRDLLEKCAMTAMNSKLISGQKVFFSKMVVDAVQTLDEDLDLDLIGIKKVTGGAMQESKLVKGVAFKKTFAYAGFEQQPKSFENPKILLLNLELELKAEKDNAEVKITDPAEYQAVVDAEWDLIYQKLQYIVDSGAKVILSRLAIGDLATQFFADRDVFCAGRVEEGDMVRVSKATGGVVQSTVNDLNDSVLGTCGKFYEAQVGGERYNFFTECAATKTATLILRGGADQFIEEVERSIHDAIMIVRRAIKNSSVVAGGGAIEMELSRHLREHSRTIHGKEQLLINAYAKALEVIPRQLCDNAGFDSTDILNKLRQKHAQPGGTWFGVDVSSESICNNYEAFVWEPSLVKINALTAATEAACLILSVDRTVKNAQSEQPPGGMPGMPGGGGMGGMGRGRGRPRRR